MKHILKVQEITDVTKTRLASGTEKLQSHLRSVMFQLVIAQSLLQQYHAVTRIEFLNSIQHSLT